MTQTHPRQATLPLEPQDLKKLRKQLIPMLIFPFFVAGIFFLIFTFVFKDLGNGFFVEGVSLYMMIGFGLFFMGIIGYMIWGFFYDIRQGIKYQILGTVTDKQLSISKSSGAGTRSSSSRTTRSYYIFVDDIKYKMDYAGYNRVQIGDQIEMEKAPKSGVTFKLEVLEQTATQATRESATIDRSYLNTKLEPAALTATDLKHLRKQHLGFVQRRVLMNFPLLFIAGSLILSDMASLLIFLFPIPIIIGVAFYRTMRATTWYFKNKSEGQKLGTTALVEDKLTITHNRAATKYQVKTSAETLSVTEEAYEQLSKNDKLVIFKPMFGKTPLSVMTMDQNEYYL